MACDLPGRGLQVSSAWPRLPRRSIEFTIGKAVVEEDLSERAARAWYNHGVLVPVTRARAMEMVGVCHAQTVPVSGVAIAK